MTQVPEDPIELRQQAVAYFLGRTHPFTQKELEEFLNLSRFTLLRYRQLGILRSFCQGNIVRYHVEDVYRLLMTRTV